MSVCPNCGYIITSSWRQNRWRTNVWFLQWDQTTDIDLEILQKLKDHPKEAQTDKYYAYRNAGRVIERIILEEYKVMGLKAFHIPREHVDHKKPRDLE
jgi:hypothetical protein